MNNITTSQQILMEKIDKSYKYLITFKGLIEKLSY